MAAEISSIDDLIVSLGGPTALARIVGRKPSAVCQWRTARTGVPPELYWIIRAAARRKGFTVPVSLFGFEQVRDAG